MNEEDKKEAKETVEQLNNSDTQEEVRRVKNLDPLVSLKMNLFSFFENRIEAIEKEDDFENEVKEAIRAKIENDDLSPAQLMQLYKEVKSQSSRALEVLLDVFKPSKEGNISPLIEKRQEDHDTGSGSMEGFEDLDGEKRDAIHKLSKFIEEYTSKKQNTNKNESE
jgi:hypothetical protein